MRLQGEFAAQAAQQAGDWLSRSGRAIASDGWERMGGVSSSVAARSASRIARAVLLACPQQGGYEKRPRARSSAEEHYLDMVGVTGSIPVAPTINQTLTANS